MVLLLFCRIFWSQWIKESSPVVTELLHCCQGNRYFCYHRPSAFLKIIHRPQARCIRVTVRFFSVAQVLLIVDKPQYYSGITQILLFHLQCVCCLFHRSRHCCNRCRTSSRPCQTRSSGGSMRWARVLMTWRRILLTWWPRLVLKRSRQHRKRLKRVKAHHEGS